MIQINYKLSLKQKHVQKRMQKLNLFSWYCYYYQWACPQDCYDKAAGTMDEWLSSKLPLFLSQVRHRVLTEVTTHRARATLPVPLRPTLGDLIIMQGSRSPRVPSSTQRVWPPALLLACNRYLIQVGWNPSMGPQERKEKCMPCLQGERAVTPRPGQPC